MKHLNRFILSMAAISVLASCDRTDPYMGGDVFASGDGAFATFDFNTGLTIREDAGTYKIPVRVLGNHGSFSVTVSASDGTAVNGKDYSIQEPSNGVLQFEGSDTLKYVVLNIARGTVGEFVDPGYKTFSLSLDSSTGGVDLGAIRKASARINDSDHPLADIIGSWTASADDYFSGSVTWTMTLLPKEGDFTKLIVDGITASFVDGIADDGSYDYSMPCVVSGSEGSRVLLFTLGREMKTAVQGSYLSLWEFNGSSVNNSGDLVFTQQTDGSFTSDQGYGIGYATSDNRVSLYDLLNPGSFRMVKQ